MDSSIKMIDDETEVPNLILRWRGSLEAGVREWAGDDRGGEVHFRLRGCCIMMHGV
jgi:hypothetical protein